MCEHFVARASASFRIGELWPFTERLERFGIAGFGWGAAWLDPGGGLADYRDTRAFRDDPGREEVGRQETTSLLVHLRRPSRLSTLTLADTQPFVDPAGRFAFSHNGDLRDWRGPRARYRAQGRIHGRADTEVGARWLEDAWDDPVLRDRHAPGELLARLHEEFGGQANLCLLAADGTPYAYAGNTENPVFTFELDGVRIATTGIYSTDRSLFRYAASGATDRRRLALGQSIALSEAPLPVTPGR
jgi:hypothetical protein